MKSNIPDSDLQARIIDAMKTVHDPEIPVNLYDLGLIYELHVEDDAARVRMTLTTPNCPVAESMPEQVRRAVESVEGIERADIELVWEPSWSSEMMSEDARMQLEMMGITWSDPKHPAPFTSLTLGRGNPPQGGRKHDEGGG